MDEKDKILCGCGVVFFSATAEEGGMWILSETCPGCDRKDNAPEVLSIPKIGRKRAATVLGGVCDLLELNPLQALNGQTDRRIRELAQHLDDLGRPTAAGRILKGWSILKGSFLNSAASVTQGQPMVGNYVTARMSRKPPKGEAQLVGIAVPPCGLCGAAVTDYEDHRDTADGFLCSKCRTAGGPELIVALESGIASLERSLNIMGRRCAALKGRLEEVKAASQKG